MYQFILLIHVLVAVCVVVLVLVQQGKGASLGPAYGGGASQTIFGSRGSGSFLLKITIGFIAVFFVTSITLNYLSTRAYKQARVVNMPVLPTRANPVQTPVSNSQTIPQNTTPDNGRHSTKPQDAAINAEHSTKPADIPVRH